MELAGLKDTQVHTPQAEQAHKLTTFEALLRAFRDFILVTNSDGTIGPIWTSRAPEKFAREHVVPERHLRKVLHPRLRAEIEGLARSTGKSGHRREVEYEVQISGAARLFSVCAIPLPRTAAGGSAILLVARELTYRKNAMAETGEREALLANAEELANFGSWELDLNTNELKMSPQLTKIFGLAPDEKFSRETYWERLHPGDRMRLRQSVDQAFAQGQPIQFAARYCAPDGQFRLHLGHARPLLDENGTAVKAIGVVQDLTELAQSHDGLRRLTQQLMNEQDSQRRHLARELHESAGQSLAALKMTLGRLRQALPEGSELAASLLDSAALLADNAVREVRTVTYLLHSPLLDEAGLGPALRWYVKGIAERSGIASALEISDPFPRYSQEIETTVFRVEQEALTNVHRYSGSASANIQVANDDAQLRIGIRDHGCGFPPAHVRH